MNTIKEKIDIFIRTAKEYNQLIETLTPLHKTDKNQYQDEILKISNNIKTEYNKIPQTIQKKIPAYLLNNNLFNEIETLNNILPNSLSTKTFINLINSGTLNNWKEWIKYKTFLNLLEYSSYEKKELINIDFGENGNKELIEETLKNNKSTFTHNVSGFITLFKKNNNFLKNLIINKLPHAIFYDTYTTKTIYNQEQLSAEDIFKAFQNTKKQGGFLNRTDIGDDFTPFFTTLLENQLDGKNTTYSHLLEKAKKEEPMLYTIMAMKNCMYCRESIIQHYIKNGNNIKNRDKAVAQFFKDNFEIPTIIEGFKEIIEIMKISNGTQNNRLAAEIIYSTLFNTSFEDYMTPHSPQTKSFISTEDSITLLLFLYENLPQYLFERNKIGSINNITKFFEKNIDTIYDKEKIKNTLLPPSHVYSIYLNLNSKDGYSKNLITQYFQTIIKKAIALNDNDTIEYIQNSIKTYSQTKTNGFISAHKKYPGKFLGFISALHENEQFNKIIKNAPLMIQLNKTLSNKPNKKSTKI